MWTLMYSRSHVHVVSPLVQVRRVSSGGGSCDTNSFRLHAADTFWYPSPPMAVTIAATTNPAIDNFIFIAFAPLFSRRSTSRTHSPPRPRTGPDEGDMRPFTLLLPLRGWRGTPPFRIPVEAPGPAPPRVLPHQGGIEHQPAFPEDLAGSVSSDPAPSDEPASDSRHFETTDVNESHRLSVGRREERDGRDDADMGTVPLDLGGGCGEPR